MMRARQSVRGAQGSMGGTRPLRRDTVNVTETQGHKAPRVRLQPNVKKIVEAISCVAGEGERRGYILSQFDILKTLFLADKSHLNKYGRPVTFDNYHAMRHGPVPSLSYSCLKQTDGAMALLRRHGIKAFPWKRSARPGADGSYRYRALKKAPDENVLSESDIKALSDALTTVKSLPYLELRKMLHADEAYLEAWEGDSPKKSFLISYGMLFQTPNFGLAERVQFLSKTN
jgi:uncharacterized phage-associated protein